MSDTAQNSARIRIASLLDENSFVEIGGLVTARATNFNLQQKETPADGVVTGYGVIDGNLVYIYSQDASVLNGSIGEMHAKKIANIYDMAMKMGAPVIGFLDCVGLRLQEATDALNGFGQIYLKQSLASGVVPQITAIFGNCGGGLAVVPTISDFTFMEEKTAKLFVNTPNSLNENTEAKCNSASAKFQSEESGIVDFVGSEAEIFAEIRQLITMLPANNEDDMSYEECTDDLNRVCAELENCVGDTSILISNIADDNVFVEVKSSHAKSMVTGFIKLNGITIGCVANRTQVYGMDGSLDKEYEAVLCPDGCQKAAEFVTFCDAFNIPILSFTNVTGYHASVDSEKKIAKAAAKLTYAFANANVAKVNVVIGKAFGSAYITMNSKSIGADLVFAWPTAEIGMMDSKLASKIMYANEDVSIINEKAAEYSALQSSVISAAGRGYVDNIIDAQDTRKYVIGAFEMLFTKREDRPGKKHGTV
jgi:acetyl-CoA carboxylase carboxyltransferase component